MMRIFSAVMLLAMLLIGTVQPAGAAASNGENWNSLLEVTPKFSWYPQAEVQKLLELKTATYGETLEEYRAQLLSEVTGGLAPTVRVDPERFVTGRPWRDYYHLSLAEFCLYLESGREIYLDNARQALSFLAAKTEQPEIEFWNYVYDAHLACLQKNREAFIEAAYRLWQNIILRFEVEKLENGEMPEQPGFAGYLPYMYENLAHLVLRKAILENEIPRLHPLSAVILDIEPKLTVENGYKTMVEQVVERMHGIHSDNRNLNFAVALIEATAKRYDFEDEKDEALLVARYNQAHKYYQLADAWADTGKGRAAVQIEYAGFLNYVISRLGDPGDPLAKNPFFARQPALAENYLERAFPQFEQLASETAREAAGEAKGYETRDNYLKALHQLWDANAKLAIVVSDYYRKNRTPDRYADIVPAARPLELYCDLFDRYARENDQVLPDNAYFLASYAARQLGEIYRERARFSTDSRADQLAFAYELQAAEIFPLDLPEILHMAYRCSDSGQVQQFYHYSSPLAARLRVSNGTATWIERHPTEFDSLISLVPTVVPKVVDNAFVLLKRLPGEEMREDDLFTRTVQASRSLEGPAANPEPSPAQRTYQFFALKNQLYGSPESPVHDFLRTLYNEVPYENHQYVALLKELR